MAVKFDELKVGDQIARRFMELEGDRLVPKYLQAHTVRLIVENTTSKERSVLTEATIDGHEYWMHDRVFTTVDDELRSWDRV
jgi:hypothetical protein